MLRGCEAPLPLARCLQGLLPPVVICTDFHSPPASTRCVLHGCKCPAPSRGAACLSVRAPGVVAWPLSTDLQSFSILSFLGSGVFYCSPGAKEYSFM